MGLDPPGDAVERCSDQQTRIQSLLRTQPICRWGSLHPQPETHGRYLRRTLR